LEQNFGLCACGTTDVVCETGQYCYDKHQVCANFPNPRKNGDKIIPLCADNVLTTGECQCDDTGQLCSVSQYCKFDHGTCWNIPVDVFIPYYPVVISGKCDSDLTKSECQTSLEYLRGKNKYIDDMWHKNNLYTQNTCTPNTNCPHSSNEAASYPTGCYLTSVRIGPEIIADFNRLNQFNRLNSSQFIENFTSSTSCTICPYSHVNAAVKYVTYNDKSIEPLVNCSPDYPCICPAVRMPQCPDLFGRERNKDACICQSLVVANQEGICTAEQFCIAQNISEQYWGCKSTPLCASFNGETLNTQRCQCAPLEDAYFSSRKYCPTNTYCDATANGTQIESCNKIAGEHLTEDGVTAPECPIVDGSQPNIDSCICPTTNVDVHKGCILPSNLTSLEGNANAAVANFTGLYCNQQTGCSTFPTCQNENGTVVNDVECQCGSNICSVNMHCYAPQSFCHSAPDMRKTTYKNGVRPEFEYIQKTCDVVPFGVGDCICGDVQVCPKGTKCTNGQCNMPKCSEIDGSYANSMGCMCGEGIENGGAVCFSKSGYYCQKNITSIMTLAENSYAKTQHDYCALNPELLPVILADGTFDYIVRCPGSFDPVSQRCQCNSNTACDYGDYCIDEQYCSANMKCRFNDGIQLHKETILCSCSDIGEVGTCRHFQACYGDSGKCANPRCAAGGSSQLQKPCDCFNGETSLGECSMTQYCYNPLNVADGGCKNEPINRCLNREGDTPNDDYDICLCGSNANRRTFCTSGQYCNDEEHMCSDEANPTCENTNGLFTNGNTTCLCKDEDGTHAICQPFHFCNAGADPKCHKQYCRDYVYGYKQLCNVQDTISQSREVENQEQIFESVVTYGNGLVQEYKECNTTDVNGICQPESFKECCRECPSDNTHILGTGLCQSDCNYTICKDGWIPPPTEGTRISFSTRFWNAYEIQSRLNPNWTNYCSEASCNVNDRKTCCVKPETCPVGKELLLCQELKHTRAYKANATCSDFECTAEDCCETRECTCTGGFPKPAYDCPQDGHEECDYCNKTYWKTANQTCSPIIECLTTQFETLPPTPRIRNRACQKLTVCVGDEFISTNETIRTGDPTSDVYDLDVAISDRTCQNRTRCLQTEYQPSVPNEYQDRTCIPLTTCDPEEYAEREWDGQQWKEDSVCRPKRTCNSTEYIVSNGTETTDRNCSAIDTACPPEKLETQVSIPGIRNRFCQEPRECTANEYETQAPNATQNRECAPLRECSETQYQSMAQTETADRECSALTECSATQYQSVAPTNTTNRQCANVTVCDPNNNEYEGTPPTATTDRQCDNCTDCVGCMDKNDCTFDPDAKISYLDVSPNGGKTCSGHICVNYDVKGTDQHVVFHPTKGALEYAQYYRFNLKTEAKLTISGVQLFKGRVSSGTGASIQKEGDYIYFQIPMNHPESTAITYKPGDGTATPFALKRDCQQAEQYVGSGNASKPVCTSVCGGDGAVLLKRTTTYEPIGDGVECLSRWTSTPCICSPNCPDDHAEDIDTYLTAPEQYKGACFNENCKCPVDCVYTVNDDFETCDAPCGEQGYKIKKIQVTTPAAHKGKACPAFGAKETCKGDYEIMRTATYGNQNKCDCDGNTMDRCGICGGKNRCVGCDNVPVLSNGNAILPDGREVSGYRKQVRDRCGICGGDGSTCAAKFKLKAENKKTTSHVLKTGLPFGIAVIVITIFVTLFYCVFKKAEKEYQAVHTEDNDEEKGSIVKFNDLNKIIF